MMPDKSDDFSDVAESAFWLSTSGAVGMVVHH